MPTAGTTTGGRKSGGGSKQQLAAAKRRPEVVNGADGKKETADQDEETNAGFGRYLRSQEGADMMKLFVVANTIVVFLTMAWPQMQHSYQILKSLIFDDDEHLFFVTVILGYSTGIWRLINDYFRREFVVYLEEEVKNNKYILEDPPASETAAVPGSSTATATDGSRPKTGATVPVTANQMLDEVLVNLGRLFTDGTPAKVGGRHRQPAKVEQPAVTTGNVPVPVPVERAPTAPDDDQWIDYWRQRSQADVGNGDGGTDSAGFCTATSKRPADPGDSCDQTL